MEKIIMATENSYTKPADVSDAEWYALDLTDSLLFVC